MNPINPLVAEMVNRLDSDLREDFEERAGIMEFEANLERAHAECLALLDVLQRNPHVLSRVIVIKVSDQWLVSTECNSASYIDYFKYDLASVIETQFNGNAVLKSYKKDAQN